MHRLATIEGDYRFNLIRIWDVKKPRMAWLMCNPSTADENQEDNISRRCIHFAKTHDCGSIEIVNLWPFIATHPADLWQAIASGKIPQSQLRRNTDFICRAAQYCGYRVAAFGVEPAKRDLAHIKQIIELYAHVGEVHCLRENAQGWPLHPLARGKLAIRNTDRLKTWEISNARM